MNVIKSHHHESSTFTGSHQRLATESSLDNRDADAVQLRDALREELLAGIVAKLGEGYLSALLEEAVAACSLPGAIGKLEKELEFIEGETEANKVGLAKLKQESGKRLLDAERAIEQQETGLISRNPVSLRNRVSFLESI